MPNAMNSIFGREAFLALLESEGVSHLFGNPGTTELPIMAALPDRPAITYVMALQESLVVAMADGYSRASGDLSACNVHVAPGLGNAMGSLYNAKWMGSPVIVTAGQQEQGHGLTEPMLYDSLVPIAQPLVKWAVEVNRLQDLPRIVHRAAKVAMTPPTGPVFISLPGDILNEQDALELGRPTRVDTSGRPSDAGLNRLADRLLAARHPVIVAGHEIATADALGEAAALAELLGAPVYQQTVCDGAHFLSEHPAFMGALTRDQRDVRDTLASLRPDVLRRLRRAAHVRVQRDRPDARRHGRGPARASRLGDGQELPGGESRCGPTSRNVSPPWSPSSKTSEARTAAGRRQRRLQRLARPTGPRSARPSAPAR